MLPRYPHLRNAPIREAILDLGVERSAGISVEALRPFAARVRESHPESNPLRQIQAQFALADDSASAMSTASTLGTVCWSSDRTRAAQARIDGFSVNHVGNYRSWEELREQARDLWPVYVDVAKPERISQAALRYINRLELPEGDVLERLRTRPQLGSSLPQIWNTYFMRVEVPLENERVAVVTEALEAPEKRPPGTSTVGLILDIGVYCTRSLDVNDPGLWEELDALRAEKNRFFFESLTEQHWEVYR